MSSIFQLFARTRLDLRNGVVVGGGGSKREGILAGPGPGVSPRAVDRGRAGPRPGVSPRAVNRGRSECIE